MPKQIEMFWNSTTNKVKLQLRAPDVAESMQNVLVSGMILNNELASPGLKNGSANIELPELNNRQGKLPCVLLFM